MSNAMTTAGWALLVMVAVTALAAWPVKSAQHRRRHARHHPRRRPRRRRPADQRHSCQTSALCRTRTPASDNRPPAVRASDTATETMLYRNWLRGLLGSADSETAQKYGAALYDAKSFTWDEAEKHPRQPEHP